MQQTMTTLFTPSCVLGFVHTFSSWT